jgi:ParB family chromosome partitioning protein
MVQLLKSGNDLQNIKKPAEAKALLPKEYVLLRDRLSLLFKTKVQMTCSPKGKGKISIPFSNEEELEQIMKAIDGIKE